MATCEPIQEAAPILKKPYSRQFFRPWKDNTVGNLRLKQIIQNERWVIGSSHNGKASRSVHPHENQTTALTDYSLQSSFLVLWHLKPVIRIEYTVRSYALQQPVSAPSSAVSDLPNLSTLNCLIGWVFWCACLPEVLRPMSLSTALSGYAKQPAILHVIRDYVSVRSCVALTSDITRHSK